MKLFSTVLIFFLLCIALLPVIAKKDSTLNELNPNSNFTNDINLNRLMRQVADNYQAKILKTPYISTVRYMEKATCHSVYCRFIEAYGFLHSGGYDTMVKVDNFSLLLTDVYKSEQVNGWDEMLVHYNQYNKTNGFEYSTDISPFYNSLQTAFRFFEINGPLSSLREYNYSLQVNEDNELLTISFDPKREGPTPEMNPRGILTINRETLDVIRVDLAMLGIYSQNFIGWVDGRGVFTYNQESNEIRINEIMIEYDIRGLLHTAILQIDAPFYQNQAVDQREYFNMQNHDSNPFIPAVSSEISFTSAFPEIDMKKVRDELEKDRPLEEQFEINSNKSWKYSITFSGDKSYGHAGDFIFNFVKNKINELQHLHFETAKSSETAKLPEVLLDKRWNRFGEIALNQNIRAEFTLSNPSNLPVKIIDVDAGCAFWEYEIDDTIINPGESITLTALPNTSIAGYFRDFIILETNTYDRFHRLGVEFTISEN